jgi:hypothetical protein
MRFACQSCGKAYNLPEEKISEKNNVKLKCRVCGAIVEVKKQGEIVAQLLPIGKRVGRISEAPAPLNSLNPAFDVAEPGDEFEEADDLVPPRAAPAPSFGSAPSNMNLAPPTAMPLPPFPGARLEPRAEINADPPLPAWSEDDTVIGAQAGVLEERPRMAVPSPAPSPPPVPLMPPPERLPNGAEHANGQSLRAAELMPRAELAAEPMPLAAESMPRAELAGRAAPPYVNPSAEPAPLANDPFPPTEKGGDAKWKMFAALITGILLGLILARLIQYR